MQTSLEARFSAALVANFMSLLQVMISSLRLLRWLLWLLRYCSQTIKFPFRETVSELSYLLYLLPCEAILMFYVSFFTETAINIGYSCHLLTDDMKEVFTIDGETLESVQQAIHDCKHKIIGDATVSRMQSKDNSLKDVEVEVISYKDNFTGEVSESTEVRIRNCSPQSTLLERFSFKCRN